MVNLSLYSDYIYNQLFPRFVEIVLTPWIDKQLLWLVIPLFVILIFTQLYFGRNKTEILGWNTAFGNTISLFWITVLLVRFTLEPLTVTQITINELFAGRLKIEFILIGILALWTILLSFSDYFHALPKKLAFKYLLI